METVSDRLLPLIVEPEQLETVLGHQRLVVLHITKPERYVQFHVPGAVFLEAGRRTQCYAGTTRTDQ